MPCQLCWISCQDLPCPDSSHDVTIVATTSHMITHSCEWDLPYHQKYPNLVISVDVFFCVALKGKHSIKKNILSPSGYEKNPFFQRVIFDT